MDCIFCKIVDGELPAKKLFENDVVVAFHDINPAAPVHVVIIPKKHIASMNDVEDDDWPIIAEMNRAAQIVARDLGIADSGYRTANNCGKNGGQEVYHIHNHLLGGAKLKPLASV
ncbi:histidine triad nucleotide-binding protein [Paenibacillus sp. KN14-4R]|uniref:histidine triad nucleotide-binding protein n=1 Tax=Paenibacillus sp. KN14-4R TaxID=3445773 RepID=UPI003FA11057